MKCFHDFDPWKVISISKGLTSVWITQTRQCKKCGFTEIKTTSGN